MSRPPLFIHIPKTAGTSLNESGVVIPTNYKGLKDGIKKQIEMDPRNAFSVDRAFTGQSFGQRMQKHLPYSYLSREYLNRYDRVVSVVRNPWSRLVSFYNFVDVIDGKFSDTWYHQPKISWEEYLSRMESFVMTPNFYWQHPYDHWAAQGDYVSSDNRIDFLRYENLKEDLSEYLNKPVNLPVTNKSREVDYRTYYTEEQKQKVANWFKVDIARWGFTFDSGARKNYWSHT